MDDEEAGLDTDMIFGGPDVPQPDWREDADDDAEDDGDPEPIAPQVLTDILGFDPGEEDEDE